MRVIAAACLLVAVTASSHAAEPWRDFEIILWQPRNATQWAALRELGVTAGAVHLADRESPERLVDDEAAPLRSAGLRFYIENIAPDFFAPYHRWFPDHPVNWRFQAAKARYLTDPLDLTAFWREPSLSDPAWLATIAARLRRTVRAHRQQHPLFYNLADEPGIGDLSIPWDFDLSPPSVAGFRRWLREQYGTIGALDAEWETQHRGWSEIEPMTTREAMARPGENVAPWSDFKEWMDEAFARAVRRGTEAVHAADHGARAGLEGAQIPGWGGYDYARLAPAVDVMELYDGGGNWEIARSLNPALVLLTTSFSTGADEARGLWRALLRGSRGVILWDPESQVVEQDGALGPRGRVVAPALREIRGGLGALLVNSTRHSDPVAVLYSPASMRIEWLRLWRPRGDAWATRDIDQSYEDANPVRTAMLDAITSLEALALHPRVTTTALIEQGMLEREGDRLLILPHAIALSAEAERAIARFVAHGGRVIADIEPARFDAHGKPRPTGGPLEALLEHGSTVRRVALEPSSLMNVLHEWGMTPAVTLATADRDPGAEIESHLFRNGGVTIIGLQAKSAAGAGASVAITPRERAFVYDLRSGQALGRRERIEIALRADTPTLLAFSPTPLPALKIAAPARLHLGESAVLEIGYAGPQPLAAAVFDVELIDPVGRHSRSSGRILLGGRNRALLPLDFARESTAVGRWEIRVRDVVGGQTAIICLDVEPHSRR